MDTLYIVKSIGSILVECLKELCERRPADPIEFIAHWLYKHTDNEVYFFEKQKQLQQLELAAIDEAKRQEQQRIRIRQLRLLVAHKKAQLRIVQQPIGDEKAIKEMSSSDDDDEQRQSVDETKRKMGDETTAEFTGTTKSGVERKSDEKRRSRTPSSGKSIKTTKKKQSQHAKHKPHEKGKKAFTTSVSSEISSDKSRDSDDSDQDSTTSSSDSGSTYSGGEQGEHVGDDLRVAKSSSGVRTEAKLPRKTKRVKIEDPDAKPEKLTSPDQKLARKRHKERKRLRGQERDSPEDASLASDVKAKTLTLDRQKGASKSLARPLSKSGSLSSVQISQKLKIKQHRKSTLKQGVTDQEVEDMDGTLEQKYLKCIELLSQLASDSDKFLEGFGRKDSGKDADGRRKVRKSSDGKPPYKSRRKVLKILEDGPQVTANLDEFLDETSPRYGRKESDNLDQQMPDDLGDTTKRRKSRKLSFQMDERKSKLIPGAMSAPRSPDTRGSSLASDDWEERSSEQGGTQPRQEPMGGALRPEPMGGALRPEPMGGALRPEEYLAKLRSETERDMVDVVRTESDSEYDVVSEDISERGSERLSLRDEPFPGKSREQREAISDVKSRKMMLKTDEYSSLLTSDQERGLRDVGLRESDQPEQQGRHQRPIPVVDPMYRQKLMKRAMKRVDRKALSAEEGEAPTDDQSPAYKYDSGVKEKEEWPTGKIADREREEWSTGKMDDRRQEEWSTGKMADRRQEEWSTGKMADREREEWSTGKIADRRQEEWSTGKMADREQEEWSTGKMADRRQAEWSTGKMADREREEWSTGKMADMRKKEWSTGKMADREQEKWSTGKMDDRRQEEWSTGKMADREQEEWSTGKMADRRQEEWSTGKMADREREESSTGKMADREREEWSTGKMADRRQEEWSAGKMADREQKEWSTGKMADREQEELSTGKIADRGKKEWSTGKMADRRQKESSTGKMTDRGQEELFTTKMADRSQDEWLSATENMAAERAERARHERLRRMSIGRQLKMKAKFAKGQERPTIDYDASLEDPILSYLADERKVQKVIESEYIRQKLAEAEEGESKKQDDDAVDSNEILLLREQARRLNEKLLEKGILPKTTVQTELLETSQMDLTEFLERQLDDLWDELVEQGEDPEDILDFQFNLVEAKQEVYTNMVRRLSTTVRAQGVPLEDKLDDDAREIVAISERPQPVEQRKSTSSLYRNIVTQKTPTGMVMYYRRGHPMEFRPVGWRIVDGRRLVCEHPLLGTLRGPSPRLPVPLNEGRELSFENLYDPEIYVNMDADLGYAERASFMDELFPMLKKDKGKSKTKPKKHRHPSESPKHDNILHSDISRASTQYTSSTFTSDTLLSDDEQDRIDYVVNFQTDAKGARSSPDLALGMHESTSFAVRDVRPMTIPIVTTTSIPEVDVESTFEPDVQDSALSPSPGRRFSGRDDSSSPQTSPSVLYIDNFMFSDTNSATTDSPTSPSLMTSSDVLTSPTEDGVRPIIKTIVSKHLYHPDLSFQTSTTTDDSVASDTHLKMTTDSDRTHDQQPDDSPRLADTRLPKRFSDSVSDFAKRESHDDVTGLSMEEKEMPDEILEPPPDSMTTSEAVEFTSDGTALRDDGTGTRQPAGSEDVLGDASDLRQDTSDEIEESTNNSNRRQTTGRLQGLGSSHGVGGSHVVGGSQVERSVKRTQVNLSDEKCETGLEIMNLKFMDRMRRKSQDHISSGQVESLEKPVDSVKIQTKSSRHAPNRSNNRINPNVVEDKLCSTNTKDRAVTSHPLKDVPCTEAMSLNAFHVSATESVRKATEQGQRLTFKIPPIKKTVQCKLKTLKVKESPLQDTLFVDQRNIDMEKWSKLLASDKGSDKMKTNIDEMETNMDKMKTAAITTRVGLTQLESQIVAMSANECAKSHSKSKFKAYSTIEDASLDKAIRTSSDSPRGAIQSTSSDRNRESTLGTVQGTARGHFQGISQGTAPGQCQGISQGTAPGQCQGISQGTARGQCEGISQGTARGQYQGISQGTAPGQCQGISQGTAPGQCQGISQGTARGQCQGISQGIERGAVAGSLEMRKSASLLPSLSHEFAVRPTNLSHPVKVARRPRTMAPLKAVHDDTATLKAVHDDTATLKTMRDKTGCLKVGPDNTATLSLTGDTHTSSSLVTRTTTQKKVGINYELLPDLRKKQPSDNPLAKGLLPSINRLSSKVPGKPFKPTKLPTRDAEDIPQNVAESGSEINTNQMTAPTNRAGADQSKSYSKNSGPQC